MLKNAEITIEMDPGTFSITKLRRLKDECYINRISLGVQSFDDIILETIGRIHKRIDIYKSIEMIYNVYGNDANYSIDLITGLPGLTSAKWIETLQEVTSTKLIPKPSHISVYDLQIEKGTVFSSWYNNNINNGDTTTGINMNGSNNNNNKKAVYKLPTDEECAFMYKYTVSNYYNMKSKKKVKIEKDAH